MTSPDTPLPDDTTPPGDCVLFATADWDTPYWTNKQHTAAHLAKAGWRVLYVESVGLRAPKMGSGTDWSRIARRLWRGLRGPRKVAEGIWVYAPLVIPFRHDHPWVRAFNQGFLSRMIGWFMRRQHFKHPMVWTYHPYVLETLAWLNRHPDTFTGPLVYHCVDDLATIPGIDAQAFLQEERALLKKASAVFTTAQALYSKCSEHNANVHNHPNVVDFAHFAKAHDDGPIPEDLACIPTPRLAYVGALSDFKVNFGLLHQVALDRPDWHTVLIGSEREGQHDPALAALSSLPNVHLLGHRPYLQLPDYLRGMDVGLLPTHVNDYTRSMFPMKYFEYLAAGLPVVSTPLAFTSHHQDGLLVAQDPSSFAAALERQLAGGRLQLTQSREMVGMHTWDARLAAMLALVSHPSNHSDRSHRSLDPHHLGPLHAPSKATKVYLPEPQMTPTQCVPPLPLMPAACTDYLRERLKASQSFLEYGAGGSTMLALSLQVPQIQSIESDQRWLESTRHAIADVDPPYRGRYVGTHIDIGPVGDWGYPTDPGHHASYWLYPATPWRHPVGGTLPDLVLIDGRFRVACFVMTCLHADPETTILFDDYVDRDYYHVVEDILQPIEVVDRMAVFKVKEGFSAVKNAFDILLPALQDPR